MKKLLLLTLFFSYFGVFAQIDAPIIAISPPTCGGNGSATITNANANFTYTFLPAGPIFSNTGQISGLVCGSTYTVTATNGNEVSPPSMPFMVGCALEIPDQPIIMTTAHSCTSNGLAFVTNYNFAFEYVFTPSGPLVAGNGLIIGLVPNVFYTVISTNGDCESIFSLPFFINPITETPDIPTVTIVGATCTAQGSASVDDYNPNYTYTFNPTGPTVSLTGLIQNFICGISYTLAANNSICESNPTNTFTIDCPLQVPAAATISTISASCTANGTVTVTNYNPLYTYTFTPTGPSVDGTGVIIDVVCGITYTVQVSAVNCQALSTTNFIVQCQFETPPTPIIQIVSATCDVGGLPRINNYDFNLTYTFSPPGPIITSAGWIQNYENLQNYTVTATSNNGCTSASATFNNGPLASPETPIIEIGTPTCETSGVVITNFSNNLQYVFTPAGPWVANGVVFGLNVGVNYMVVATNGGCSSDASTPFSITTQMPETPPMPMIVVTQPTCFDDGYAVVANFSDQYTYTFVPQGPQVSPGGLITGVVCGVVYAIVATNGNCSSNVVSFIVGCAIQTPVAPIVCVSNGQAVIANYSPNLFYIFTPQANVQINNNGVIFGLNPNIDYTVVSSNGATCNSLPSNVFNISVPNNCNAATLIAFYDSNNNGIKDPDELPFEFGNFNFTVNGGAIQNGYGSNGTYLIFDTNPDNIYALSYSIYANYQVFYQCTTSYNNVNINGSNTYYFPIVALNPNYQDLSVVILTYQPPRAGENHFVMVRYRNNSPNVVPNGTITFTKDNAVSMVSTSPSSTINGTGFVYDFTNLMPFEQRDIYVTMYTPPLPTVQINQPITHTVSITPTENDININNNTFSLTQHVVAAYDPNDKMEAHGERIVFADYSPDEEFTYTIRFENEGNIYAINVRVTDELDAKIDETTVRMVAASHDYQLIREGNMLTWRFDNINLPVSVPGTMIGHGFITFSVKMKPGIQLGDTVPNKASIYFDTNPPIITNEFVTLFYDPLSTNGIQNQVAIYPNPSNDWVNIQSQALIFGYTLVDLHGKTLMERQHIQDTQTRLSLQDLSTGIYLLKIKTDQGDSMHKLVKK